MALYGVYCYECLEIYNLLFPLFNIPFLLIITVSCRCSFTWFVVAVSGLVCSFPRLVVHRRFFVLMIAVYGLVIITLYYYFSTAFCLRGWSSCFVGSLSFPLGLVCWLFSVCGLVVITLLHCSLTAFCLRGWGSCFVGSLLVRLGLVYRPFVCVAGVWLWSALCFSVGSCVLSAFCPLYCPFCFRVLCGVCAPLALCLLGRVLCGSLLAL